jgi:hypothetical protein
MTIARQQFGKHRLQAGIAMNRSESPLICNCVISTFFGDNSQQEAFPGYALDYIRCRTENNDSFVRELLFKAVAVEVSHNGRADTRSLVRNGASLRKSLIMSGYN